MCANYMACVDGSEMEDEFGVREQEGIAGGGGGGQADADSAEDELDEIRAAAGLDESVGGAGAGAGDADPLRGPGGNKQAFPTDGNQPFIRLSDKGKLMVERGHFGLLPHFAKEVAYGRNTYNAKSETIHQLVSFRLSWMDGRRCIVPANWIYEPKYDEDGKNPVRWRINRADGRPLGIAGIWRAWRSPHGIMHNSFTMITVNADRHPFMSQFHAPNKEKRMVVMLTPDEYDAWLTCSVDEAKDFFKMYTGELVGRPDPLPARKKKAPAEPKAPRVKKPKAPPAIEDPGLF